MNKVILLAICVALFGCSQNAKKDGDMTKSPAQPTMATQAQDNATAGKQQPSMKQTKPAELLPEIAAAYKGIMVAVTNIKSNTNTETEVAFNTEMKITGTPLAITVQALFPDFSMLDGGVANKSMKENNPGAKVMIKKDGAVVFDGWLFQKFPDTHGFEDPDFKVFMVKTVPVK